MTLRGFPGRWAVYGLGIALSLGTVTPVAAADKPARSPGVTTIHHKSRSFKIPFNVDPAERSRLSEVQLWVSEDSGYSWKAVSRTTPDHPAFNLSWLRQPDDPISWIPLPLAYYAMLMANTWLGWPLNSVVATGALQSIPGELYEAAEMDGASAWQKFRTVTVPFLRPAMLPYAIYGFVITFNLFFLPFFMTAGEPFGRTEILVTQAYRLAYERRLFGVAAAFAVYLFFLLLVITLITNRMAKATKSYAD